MRSFRVLAVLLLAVLPCLAFAQWRVVAVNTEVEAMRFDTIPQAHDFMVDFLTAQEAQLHFPLRHLD